MSLHEILQLGNCPYPRQRVPPNRAVMKHFASLYEIPQHRIQTICWRNIPLLNRPVPVLRKCKQVQQVLFASVRQEQLSEDFSSFSNKRRKYIYAYLKLSIYTIFLLRLMLRYVIQLKISRRCIVSPEAVKFGGGTKARSEKQSHF